MARVEIDEAELATHRGLTAALNGMLANPKSRSLVLQARKIADPNAHVPEVDAAAPIIGEMQRIREEMAAERKARKEEAEKAAEERAIATAQATLDKQEAQLRTAGWRDDGIAAVRKHAEERGIFDLEVAAAHFEKLNPPPEPVTPNGFGSWGAAPARRSAERVPA